MNLCHSTNFLHMICTMARSEHVLLTARGRHSTQFAESTRSRKRLLFHCHVRWPDLVFNGSFLQRSNLKISANILQYHIKNYSCYVDSRILLQYGSSMSHSEKSSWPLKSSTLYFIQIYRLWYMRCRRGRKTNLCGPDLFKLTGNPTVPHPKQKLTVLGFLKGEGMKKGIQ